MRPRWIGVGILLVASGLGGAQAAQAQPYGGLWAGSAEACRNDDSDNRLEINRDRFFWYETRCTASDVRSAGPAAWTMRLSCEGEGRRFSARPRITMPAPDRLVIENGPVGPDPRRQSYLRCPAR